MFIQRTINELSGEIIIIIFNTYIFLEIPRPYSMDLLLIKNIAFLIN